MADLTTREVELLRGDEQAGMQDECVLVRQVFDVDEAKRDAYGDADETPQDDGVPTPCAFSWLSVDEASRISEIPTGVAQVRIPHGVSRENLGGVNLTKVAGAVLETPLKFRLIGPAQVGISAVTLRLELTEEIDD